MSSRNTLYLPILYVIVLFTRYIPNPSNLHHGIILATSRGNLNIIIFNIPNTRIILYNNNMYSTLYGRVFLIISRYIVS